MQMRSRPLDIDSPAAQAIFASLLTLIGLLVRLPAPLSASFPLNDGGLFYRMILDLQANHFVLPVFTTYNTGDIPYVYPPFAFYFSGLIASGLGLDPLMLLRILPAILSALCIPAFYFLALDFLRPRQETALAAALAFALTPRGFEWHIMGGGLTRTFGLLFALLALRAARALFTQPSKRQILATVLWGTLTVLAHPEASLQAAMAALLFYLVLDRTWRGAFHAATAAGGILALSAPWWGTVLLRFGTGPFLAGFAAARAGALAGAGGRIFLSVAFNFTEEIYLPLIAMFGLIGLFAELGRREFLLPLWVTVPLLLEPRSAPQYMVIPLAMLAGIGLVQVLLPALRAAAHSDAAGQNKAPRALSVYVFLYVLISAYLVGFRIAEFMTLQPPERTGLAWVKDNIPAGSRFILVTGGGPVSDPLAEWFPVLTDRKSLNTLFGLEWKSDVSFGEEISKYRALQQCLNRDAACLLAWQDIHGQDFTHVLVRKQEEANPLVESLRAAPGFSLIYENSGIAIFKLEPP
jgi:hypothetical protein